MGIHFGQIFIPSDVITGFIGLLLGWIIGIIPILIKRKEEARKPKVICLCGSIRFMKEYLEEYTRLSVEGNIVLLPSLRLGLYPLRGKTHEELLSLHLCRIDLADEIFVIDPGGYTGPTTEEEIGYAKFTGKPVNYLSARLDEMAMQDKGMCE